MCILYDEVSMQRSRFGQTNPCASQMQAYAQAQMAQGQAAGMVSFDGGASLATANDQFNQAAQALQQCQANPPTTISQDIRAAAPVVGSLATLGTGIASLFMGSRTPPQQPVVSQQPMVVTQSSNSTLIIAVIGGAVLLLVVVMMSRK